MDPSPHPSSSIDNAAYPESDYMPRAPPPPDNHDVKRGAPSASSSSFMLLGDSSSRTTPAPSHSIPSLNLPPSSPVTPWSPDGASALHPHLPPPPSYDSSCGLPSPVSRPGTSGSGPFSDSHALLTEPAAPAPVHSPTTPTRPYTYRTVPHVPAHSPGANSTSPSVAHGRAIGLGNLGGPGRLQSMSSSPVALGSSGPGSEAVAAARRRRRKVRLGICAGLMCLLLLFLVALAVGIAVGVLKVHKKDERERVA